MVEVEEVEAIKTVSQFKKSLNTKINSVPQILLLSNVPQLSKSRENPGHFLHNHAGYKSPRSHFT